MEDVFAPGGALERALSQVGDAEYEPRREQAALAAAVERALATGQHLVAEAGAGGGKTPADLLPAPQAGLRGGVAPAAEAPQGQVIVEDVPIAAAGGGGEGDRDGAE